jgi:choline dehydrogenase
MNAMIYIRGHRCDYDSWRDAGNSGWGFDDLLPYFLCSENNERGASALHATGGQLPVADLRCPNPLSLAFIDACVECGIPANEDFNGAEQEGAGLYQVNQFEGERWSAARAFLAPLRRSRNLKVLACAHATRVLFEKQRAIGVEFLLNGGTQKAFAEAEVILACGSINSPQLLMLSGVGPLDHLRAHDISMVCDLPGVGRNLQDHLSAGVMYQCKQRITLDCVEDPGNLFRFLLKRQGPLTSNVAEGGAFVRSRQQFAVPDLQLFFAPAFFIDHGFTRPPGCGFSIGVVQLRPESRGRIELRSANPLAPPRIKVNYLSTETDRRALLEGVRICRRIASAKAFDSFRGEPYLPDAGVHDDDGLRDLIHEHSQTMYHPVGTCKMGIDPLAVVDPKLRIHGLDNIRVVDASIMPAMIGGNTNAPTLMIAEKAASMITGQKVQETQASLG